MLKRLFTINFLDAFIAGLIAVLIPILMQSRGLKIEEIGLIFSLAPLIKIIVRLAASFFADRFGDRIIYIFCSISNLLQGIFYLIANNPLTFAAGKFFEGARESLIFSVNRTSLMELVPEKRHFVFSSLFSGRLLYNALGGLAVWIFAFYGVDFLLYLVIFISFYMIYSSYFLKNTKHMLKIPSLEFILKELKTRIKIPLVLSLGSWMYVTVLYIVFPLYFTQLGYNISQIGLLYSIYFIIAGTAMNIAAHKMIKSKYAAFFGTLFFCTPVLGMIIFEKEFTPIFFFLMAIGDSLLGVLWEELSYISISKYTNRASMLAVFNIPIYFFVFLGNASSGFLINLFGYHSLFFLLILSEIGFALFALEISKNHFKL